MAPRWSGKHMRVASLCKKDSSDLFMDAETAEAFGSEMCEFDVADINEHTSGACRSQKEDASRGYMTKSIKQTQKASPRRSPRVCYPTAPPLPPLAAGRGEKMDAASFMHAPPSHQPCVVEPPCRPSSFAPPTDCGPVYATNSCPPLSSQDDWEQDVARRPQLHPVHKHRHRGHGGVGSLVGQVFPGDVLNIVGDNNALSRLGAVGGFMGHVLLVVSPPHAINKHSEVGMTFQEHLFNGSGSADLYSVGIVESSRSTEGLYEAQVVLSLESSGRVRLLGELGGDTIFLNEGMDEVHIWQSPSEFRGDHFRLDVMFEVLDDMRSSAQNWSWFTAVRAFLMSGDISTHEVGHATMQEVQDGWRAEPICTSIVVIFWQRYLHKLARLEALDPLRLILQLMPLKADRVLPGELLNTMLSRGWSLWNGADSSRITGNRCRAVTF